MKNRQIVLILLLNLIIELIFKSSNITVLVLLDLVVLSTIVIIQKSITFPLIVLFLFCSFVIELFAFKVIGVTGLALFLSLATVQITGYFIHIFNINRKHILSLLLFYSFYLCYRIIINLILTEPALIDPTAIVINILILIFYNWVSSKLYTNKYVLER